MKQFMEKLEAEEQSIFSSAGISSQQRRTSKAVIARNKYKKMSSQVQEELHSHSRAIPKLFDMANFPQQLNNNNNAPQIIDFTKNAQEEEENDMNLQTPKVIKTPSEYLNSITTTIDCEKDLELYKIDRAITTEKISVVGIQILSRQLQEAYGDMKYLIRCYHKNQKIFEMPLNEPPLFVDALHSTFAYVMRGNLQKIYAIDLGGKYQNGLLIGNNDKKTPMKDVFLVVHNLFQNNLSVQSFKLGVYKLDAIKAVFISNQDIYIIPFTLNMEEHKRKPTYYQQFRKQIQSDCFNFKNEESSDEEDDGSNEQDKDSFRSDKDLNLANQLLIRRESTEEILDHAQIEIQKIFDFGVNQKYTINDQYDNKPYEVVILQDQAKSVHVMRGKGFGNRFRLMNTIRLKQKVVSHNRMIYEVIDALLISSFKILFLVKVQTYQHSDKRTPAPTRKEIQDNNYKATKISYRIQVWEIDQKTDKKPATFEIDDKQINNILINWRSMIAVDNNNNEFYFPDYGKQDQGDIIGQKIIKMIINNDSKSINSFQLSLFHVYDFIGHHMLINEAQKIASMSGLLYQDIMLFENFLYIVHGKFVTIVDINDYKDKKNHYHLSLINNQKNNNYNQNDLIAARQFADFNQEVAAIMVLDKEDITEINSRWRIITVLKSGHILEIVEQFNEQDHDSSNLKTHGIQTTGFLFGIGNKQDQGQLQRRNFSFQRDFLVNENLKEARLPGQLIKIYRNDTNQTTVPFFLVKKDDGTFVICTIELRKQLLKEYHFIDTDEKTEYLVINSLRTNHEDILVVDIKGGEEQAEIDQQLRHFRLLNRKIEGKKDKKLKLIKHEDIPRDINNLSYLIASFSYEENIYLVFPKKIQKYNYITNDFEEINLNENIQNLKIFEEQYFYWRQFERSEFYIPIHNHLYFDCITELTEIKSRSAKKEYQLFSGNACVYPHLANIYHDRISNHISAFIDYNVIKIFPLLHINRIKLKNQGLKSTDNNQVHILGTQMFSNFIYSLHSNNTLQQWNVQTGKHVKTKNINTNKQFMNRYNQSIEIDLKEFKVQQQIKQKYFLIKRDIDERKKRKNLFQKNNAASFEQVNALGPIGPIMEELPPIPSYRHNYSGILFDDFEAENDEQPQYYNSFEEPEQENEQFQSNIFLHLHNQALSFKSNVPIQKKKTVKPKEILIKDFGIETQNQPQIRLAEYLIIELLENCSDSDKTQDTDLNKSLRKNETVDKIKIREVRKFVGPNFISFNNFGLYASEDLELFAFYYKDLYKNLQTYYFKLEMTDSTDLLNYEDKLVKVCQQIPNTLFSVHSSDFKYYLRQNQNEELEVTPFNLHEKEENEQQEAQKQLFEINSKIRDLYNSSLKEREPSFLSKNEILFMSSDNIILCFKIFEDERGSKNALKEVFNVAQCRFPGSQRQIPLDSMFMINNRLIGENIMIYERERHPRNPARTLERVAPNYFNIFFQQQAHSDQDIDDASEMKYIQNHYKQKVEFCQKMYTGYIFISKDFIGEKSYQTEIHIVNTFNFYQWRAMHLIKNQRIIIEDISKMQLQNLCFAQLPNGKTLLHMIKRNQESIKSLYNIVYDKNVDKEPFYVPILEDQYQNTVLHNILLKQETKQINTFNNFQNVKNQVAMEILRRMGDYPFDLYKIRMSSVIWPLIQIDIQQFTQYLESRAKKPSMLTQIQMGKVKEDYVRIVTSNELWCLSEKKIRDRVENPRDEIKQVEMKVLDVAFIHLSKNMIERRYNSNLIYEKLADTDNVTVFSYASVKALIEIKWNYTKYRILFLLMIPYILLLIFFLFYTAFDLESFEYYEITDRETASKALRSLVLIFTSYFAVLESRQIFISGLKYFLNGWNYMDMLIIFLIFIAEIIQAQTIDYDIQEDEKDRLSNLTKAVRTIESVVAILIWLRLLYFFRIFRTTGYYIRMLVEVIKDIKYFIFIFALTIISFAHAWFIFLKNNDEGSQLSSFSMALGYVYQLALGNFSTDQFGDYKIEISWTFFVLSTLMLQIVLINLLISIVSDTYQRIKQNYNVIMYKDMLYMIIENRFLSIGRLREDLTGQYLFMAVPVRQDDQNKALLARLDDMEQVLREQLKFQIERKRRTNQLLKVEEKENQILDRLDKIDEKFKTLLEAFNSQK